MVRSDLQCNKFDGLTRKKYPFSISIIGPSISLLWAMQIVLLVNVLMGGFDYRL